MIYVVDGEPAVRRSLERLLRTAGYEVLAFESSPTFVAAAPGLRSGCVLLDLQMPGLGGLEVQQCLRERSVSLPVIMMSGNADVRMAVKAMKGGAADFIEKPFDDGRLFSAIHSAVSRIVRGDVSEAAADAARRLTALTSREHEVLDALASGYTTKMIAYELGLSVRTVEAHRGRMLERLGTKRLAQAIRYAVLASLA
ncbi:MULTISPECIES: response regulator [Rhodomicrobium]|uniref:response regulator transcription factor n=1 Tax=Rhodomicrobium TaxID=1068 RepID=UPI000B4B2660|nr:MULTISPECIES: response regulator [Rhodomicrobium]